MTLCRESNDWAPRPKDKRRLSELVELWFDLHGVSLSDGVRRVAILRACAKDMGDPVARLVDGAKIAGIRARWLAAGVTGKTANNRLGYLKAVYNELHQLDVIGYPCPFTCIRPVRLQERPLAYLTKPADCRTARSAPGAHHVSTSGHGGANLPSDWGKVG